MQSRNPKVAAQVAAQVAAHLGLFLAADLPNKPVVLCRCCKIRPMEFQLVDPLGELLEDSSGFCEACVTPQPNGDEGLEAEYAHRAKYDNPAGLDLVDAIHAEYLAYCAKEREDTEKRLKQLNNLKLRQDAMFEDLQAGTYGFDAGMFLDDMIQTADDYNSLTRRLNVLDLAI